MPSCIWAKEQLPESMENYLATASSDKELDKDVFCVHYCLTFISSMSSTKHWKIKEGVKVGGVLIGTSDSICR